MHRLCLAGLLLAAGCHNVYGPFAYRGPARPDDPMLSINEQQRRGRDRYSTPDPDRTVAPPTRVESPGVVGR